MEYNITSLSVLGSTQDVAHERARMDSSEGTVIQALEMTSGRGTHGRVWNAPVGNLYMSVILRPDCTARQIGQLSFVAAVAVARAITPLLRPSEKLKLKWPNDVLVSGRKICGILLESELKEDRVSYLILGIGVNIEHTPEKQAAALISYIYEQISVSNMRDAILNEFTNAYDLWQEKGFALIREEWLKKAYRLGEEINVSQRDGSKIKGMFIDLDEEGYLVLSIDDKIKRLSAGGIELET